MSYSKRSRHSCSPSPYKRYSRSLLRSVSRSRSISRSRSRELSVENLGNNLYVTGLSTRITKRDLEKHFSTEGKVEDVHLVVDPRTRESRGFGFVTMSTVEEADHCIKYLNRSVLDGRVIMVEKARRRRGRTPTPGRYLGLRTINVHRRSPNHSTYYRSHSPRFSSEQGRSRSYSPCYRRRRSYSPYYGRRGSYTPRYSRGRSYSRSPSPYRRSPFGRRDRCYTPYGSRYYSPDDCYYRKSHYRSVSRSISPRARRGSMRSHSRSVSPRSWRSWSHSCSVSPRPRRSWRSYSRIVSPRRLRRSYSRSISPGYRRSYSRSIFPRLRKSISSSVSPGPSHRRDYSRDSHSSTSYSRSSGSSCSRPVLSSVNTLRSASPSS